MELKQFMELVALRNATIKTMQEHEDKGYHEGSGISFTKELAEDVRKLNKFISSVLDDGLSFEDKTKVFRINQYEN